MLPDVLWSRPTLVLTNEVIYIFTPIYVYLLGPDSTSVSSLVVVTKSTFKA